MTVRPALLAVDDDTVVLAAVARDLRREYGERYRVLHAASGEEALRMLEELRLRDQPVALLLVDQRMPGTTGVEVLARALRLAPGAKRVLLTAYADSDAAIRAINEAQLDYYLMKPWHPPQERLYPVLNELLDDWAASWVPRSEGLTVLGHRWSAPSHAVRDFLVRNLVPYRWLDVEESDEAQELLALAGEGGDALPLVLFPDGGRLAAPDIPALAQRLGLHVRAELPAYDLVIVGAGPAGLAAAVYGASEGLRTLLVECEAPGGQAGTSSRIENYLGFPAGLSGGELARRATAQAKRFGAEILAPQRVAGLGLRDAQPMACLQDGSRLVGRALLVATGVAYRTLDAPGVAERVGAGVYYGAALTEARSVRGADAFVVGAGNSAGQAAMYLAQHARSVTLLVRGSSLSQSMSHYLIAQLEATPNVRIRPRTQVASVEGDGHLEAVMVEDRDTGERETLPAAGLFVLIGAEPRTEWLDGAIARDPRGFIVSGPDLERNGALKGWRLRRKPFWLETSAPGVFVAGDVRHRSIKRIASAVGEGAMAVQFVHEHLAAS